jgi:O-antigen/teichoic acid export membrane protein
MSLIAQAAAAPAPTEPAGPPEESMARRVGGNSLWLIARPLALNVLSILSNVYIVRELGAAGYGAFNLGFAQVALFAPLCNLGLRAAAVRAIAQNRESAPAVVGALHALRLLLTAITVLLVIGWLSLPTYSATTRLIGLAAVCSMICTSMGASAIDLFQGFERSRLAAQPQMLGGLWLTLLSVAALLVGWGLPGFVAAYVAGAAIQLHLLHRAAARELFKIIPRWDWPRMKELGRAARPFAFLSVMSNVTDAPVVDVLILGALHGSGAVGPYTAALGLVMRLLMIPYGVGDALYPAVAAGFRDHRAEVVTTVRRCILNLALLTVPAAVALTFLAPTILRLLYGEEYVGATDALRLIGWLLPLMGVNYVMRECLSAIHRQDVVVRLTLVSCVLLVGLYAALIPLFGIVGAALAGVLREAVMLLLWARPFSAELERPFPVRELGRLSLAALAMSLPLALFGSRYGPIAAIAAGVMGSALYAVVALRTGVLDLSALRRRAA